tara:strand:+ start:362 stop:1609 length:1248 start_codon:yes stop_codon:yes gene_type:complete
MARTRLSLEEQKLLIERQKEERLRRLQERNQAGLLNPRAIRANPEVANTNLLDSSVTNVNANMTPIPAGLLQRGVEGANNPYTPSYNQSNIVNDPKLKSAMENVYKPTMRERVGGFFNRANQSFQNAAPIFAVAREFHKAGAPRQIGAPMQGDPYGAMIEIAQTNKENENLAQLRSQYPQYANLPNEQFLNVIESLAKDGKLNIGNQLQQTKEQRDVNQLRNIKNSMQTGDADAALSYGAIDRLAGGINLVTGKVGLPLKKYQRANTATEGFIRDAMNASRANFDGRQTNLLFEFIREEMPEPNMNEQQALERTKTVYRRFDDAITGYEQLLDDPNSDLTTSQRGNISKMLKLYEGVRDRALVRIKSIEDVISTSKLEKAAGESVYEAPEVSDTNLDTSEINEWNNSLSIREQIQ